MFNKINLSTNKASGPDELPSIVLKLCAKELAPMLRGLFTQSLDTGSELYHAIRNLQMLFHLAIDPSPSALYICCKLLTYYL